MNTMRRRAWPVAALIATATFAACGGDAVPSELVGRWTTDDPRYEGRAFELTDSSLSIYTAPDAVTRHDIVGVETDTDEAGQIVLTIEYEDGDASLTFAVAYEPAPGGGTPGWVHLANQPDFEWTKSGAGS